MLRPHQFLKGLLRSIKGQVLPDAIGWGPSSRMHFGAIHSFPSSHDGTSPSLGAKSQGSRSEGVSAERRRGVCLIKGYFEVNHDELSLKTGTQASWAFIVGSYTRQGVTPLAPSGDHRDVGG